MATGEDNNKAKEGKGFAGLSSLVSEIETPQSPVTKNEPPAAASAAPGVARPAWQSEQPTPPPSKPPSYQAPAPPSSDSSVGKWLLGIAAVIGWLWVMGESNKKPASPTQTYAPSAQAPAFTTPSPTVSAPEQAPSRPVETKPPVGQDLVFSVAQIRYCLAEDIRMEGAKSVLNNYSDSDVDSFNVLVSDYNSRCSNFRYRRGTLESARRDIESFRSQLETEGKSRFTRSPSTGSLSAPELIRTAPDATVQAIQEKLEELHYNVGPTDGLMGRDTRSAIIAFQQNNGLVATGVADQALLLLLQRGTQRETPQSRPVSTSLQLSPAEAASLEAACSTDKYVNGPAAYRECVEKQKIALAAGVRRPNLNSLSSAEQQSIEAACSTEKYVSGPAAYNQCLSNQLLAVSQGVTRPDLSKLSSPEKQSIEAACSTDKYVNGPAAYNQCLTSQLASMSGQGTTRPDISRLSAPEKQSIEAACSTDKYVKGPAAYNRCLKIQLVEWEKQGGRPDLSNLSSAEKSSIEAACSTEKYVKGPAEYNRCLSRQLARL